MKTINTAIYLAALTVFPVSFMIPEDKKTAVAYALQQAFATTQFEAISTLTAGLSSALIYKIVVHGKPYLLRVITSTDAISNPAHWFDSMATAAHAGIAPRVWYTSVDDRIAITDFIDAKPFPPVMARVMLPALLARLHALPGFPRRVNYFDFVNNTIQKFKTNQILPDRITGELFALYQRINEVYPRNESVGCHNDLKPENILFDGERPWLVDWEAAFLNDRYFDLAIVANFIVMNDADERAYLKNYFGEDATKYQLARFFLMRQVLHMAAFTFFMTLLPTGKASDPDLPISGFREFNDLMWAGQIDLNDSDAKLQYARVHMQQLQYNFGLKQFEESLKIVSDSHLY